MDPLLACRYMLSGLPSAVYRLIRPIRARAVVEPRLPRHRRMAAICATVARRVGFEPPQSIRGGHRVFETLKMEEGRQQEADLA